MRQDCCVSCKSHSLLSFRPRECQSPVATLQARVLLSCLLALPHGPCPPALLERTLRGQGMVPLPILWGWVLMAAVRTGQMPGRESRSVGQRREGGLGTGAQGGTALLRPSQAWPLALRNYPFCSPLSPLGTSHGTPSLGYGCPRYFWGRPPPRYLQPGLPVYFRCPCELGGAKAQVGPGTSRTG